MIQGNLSKGIQKCIHKGYSYLHKGYIEMNTYIQDTGIQKGDSDRIQYDTKTVVFMTHVL